MQSFSQSTKDSLHHWRYEKAEELLPEGDLSEPVTKTESTDTILSVTADTAQTLYLRGFVGDTYKNGTWSALDAETAAEDACKMEHDAIGHYVRPDVLELKVNEK